MLNFPDLFDMFVNNFTNMNPQAREEKEKFLQKKLQEWGPFLSNKPSDLRRSIEIIMQCVGCNRAEAESLYATFQEKAQACIQSSHTVERKAQSIGAMISHMTSSWGQEEKERLNQLIATVNPDAPSESNAVSERLVVGMIGNALSQTQNPVLKTCGAALNIVAGSGQVPRVVAPFVAPLRVGFKGVRLVWRHCLPGVVKAPVNFVGDRIRQGAQQVVSDSTVEVLQRAKDIYDVLNNVTNGALITVAAFAMGLSFLLAMKTTQQRLGVIADPESASMKGADLVFCDVMFIKYLNVLPATFRLPFRTGDRRNRAVYFVLRVIYFVHVNGMVYGVFKIIIVMVFSSCSRLLPESFADTLTALRALNTASPRARA